MRTNESKLKNLQIELAFTKDTQRQFEILEEIKLEKLKNKKK